MNIPSKSCPNCLGAEQIIGVCETCGGSGLVYPGYCCFNCGRSVQQEYNNQRICYKEECRVEASKEINRPLNENSLTDDELADRYRYLCSGS